MTFDKDFRGLKITFIGQASLNDTHGGAIRLKAMIGLLNNLGIEVNLVTYSFYSEKFSIDKVEYSQLLRSTTICVPNGLPKFLKACAIIPSFVYALRYSRNSDILFTNFRSILSSIPTVILGKIFDKPVISDYLDIDRIVPDILYRYIAKNSNVIFAITYLLQNKAEEYGGRCVVYLPNFVDADHFKVDDEIREKIRGKLGIKNDEIVVGYAGSFAYWEGIPILLQAFKNLVAENPKIKLAIMGWFRRPNICDDIEYLVENLGIKKDTILIPPQPHDLVPEFLSAFDVLCCPKIDCDINRLITPIKIVEFMSMGLPTVASSVGGIPDMIKNGVNGFLAIPGNPENLKEILERIISDPGLAKMIGANARATVKEKYTYTAIENTVIETIHAIIKKNGKIMK